MLAVALGATVYLWDGETHTVTELMTLPSSAAYISSVGWLDDGVHLAVGASRAPPPAPALRGRSAWPARARPTGSKRLCRAAAGTSQAELMLFDVVKAKQVPPASCSRPNGRLRPSWRDVTSISIAVYSAAPSTRRARVRA